MYRQYEAGGALYLIHFHFEKERKKKIRTQTIHVLLDASDLLLFFLNFGSFGCSHIPLMHVVLHAN